MNRRKSLKASVVGSFEIGYSEKELKECIRFDLVK